MRSLEEVLAELKAAEKEYAQKCQKYGIEEKHKKKNDAEVSLDENGNPLDTNADVNANIESENTQDEASK